VSVETAPDFIATSKRVVCQGWRCTSIAHWQLWAGLYCYDHAIRAGWLPGPVIRPGTQLAIDTSGARPGWGRA